MLGEDLSGRFDYLFEPLDVVESAGNGDVVAPRLDSWEPLRAELETFVDRVARRETPDEREDAAVRLVATIEASERSLAHGGAPVDVR